MHRTNIAAFRKKVWEYYRAHNRNSLPWRKTRDPYKILVSELMLQQTQVARVMPKYKLFLQQFPTIKALAKASLANVLKAWQGLGYNRRAKFLHACAKEVVAKYKGVLPFTESELVSLPGIGKATASALLAFAFNKPVLYLETNVRSVFLHHFFENNDGVGDNELIPLIEQAAKGQDPREWNWALLDYGVYIKSLHPNPSRRSKHYTKQSKFQGSARQLRGRILALLAEGPQTKNVIIKTLNNDPRAAEILSNLQSEHLITLHSSRYHLG